MESTSSFLPIEEVLRDQYPEVRDFEVEAPLPDELWYEWLRTLSVSDMDQLERRLRGVRGGTAASAFGSGMRTLMLRMLGGEKRVYDRRSTTFTAER